MRVFERELKLSLFFGDSRFSVVRVVRCKKV